MSETVVSVHVPENSVTFSEPNDAKRPTQTRLKLQTTGIVVDDVSKSKSGSSDGLRYRKRRKRGKSKRRRPKPYSRSWQERSETEERDSGKRVNNVRAKLFASGQPVAPYNTTQFLMDDHNDLQNLDVKLQAVTTNTDGSNLSVLQRPSRARDSSLSVDSSEDYFYSSPEDEGDFLSKEFSNTYEDLHAERLNSMPKAQLIQEYLQMEAKVDVLEKRLKKASGGDSKGDSSVSVCDKGESGNEGNLEGDTSQKMSSLKQEIDKLYMENEQLRRENDRLRCSYLKEKSVHTESSVDSESDSTPSCRCTDSETSCSCSSHSDSDSVGCSSSEEEQSTTEQRSHDVELTEESSSKQDFHEEVSEMDDCDKSAPNLRTTDNDQ